MFTFASPYYFFLLLPLVAAAAWIYRRRTRVGIVFSRAHVLRMQPATWRLRLSACLPALVLLALALLVIALARPRTVFERMHRSVNAIAIQMVVDMSGSMEALDLSDISGNQIVRRRSRLDAVKETFAAFIKNRPDDLIGLVTFGGYASTRCPLTSDHESLLHILSGIEIPKSDVNGLAVDQEEVMTAVGDALATACARLREADTKSRIMVLLSDGESNTGIFQPDEAARLARQLGFKVYTIGVGTTGEAPFPARDMFGREVLVPQPVLLDEALLKRIATTTGGRYFNVRDPQGLERALEDINTLETTRVEREVYQQYNELFDVFMAPGLLLLVLATGLNMLWARRLI
ncbi:MAG: VWA domain-containing protein [Verrucomicrobia bacterium]|nr:VWA domain-containing protein [Verrucomicrobiota bacterium]